MSVTIRNLWSVTNGKNDLSFCNNRRTVCFLSISNVVCTHTFSSLYTYGLNSYGLVIGTMLAISTYIYFPLKNLIPRLCFGKRVLVSEKKFTVSHEYSTQCYFVAVVRPYAKRRDFDEDRREGAREHSSHPTTFREREFRSPIEVFMTRSTAERLSLPASPCWIRTEGVSETSHAIISDFDYMISPQKKPRICRSRKRRKVLGN